MANPLTSEANESVVVDGRRLFFRRRGSGPVVVLETGASGGGAYGSVPDAIARFATVVTYDRAGVANSNPRVGATTIREIAHDLHALLQTHFSDRGVILVGWSLTGLSALIHPLLYPADVAGVVLIDPTPFDLYDNPRNAGMLANPGRAVAVQRFLARLGHGKLWGRSTLSRYIENGCGRTPDPHELSAYIDTLVRLPREHAYPELQNMRTSCDIARQMVRDQPYPDMPLMVLSAEVDTLVSGEAAIAKHRNHRAIAALSAQGQYMPVAGGSHMMTLDRPDAIVDAVRSLV